MFVFQRTRWVGGKDMAKGRLGWVGPPIKYLPWPRAALPLNLKQRLLYSIT